MNARRRRGPLAAFALLALGTATSAGCGGPDGPPGARTTVPSPDRACEIPASIERTPDDEDRIGEVARSLVAQGPCVVGAARRWLAAHPKATDGSPAARAVVRAVGALVESLPSAPREEAIDVLFDAEAVGDATVARDALEGLAKAPREVAARIGRALADAEGRERDRALALVEALGLKEPSLVAPIARLVDAAARGPRAPWPTAADAADGALDRLLRRLEAPGPVFLDAIGREGDHGASIRIARRAWTGPREKAALDEVRRRWSGLAEPIRADFVGGIGDETLDLLPGSPAVIELRRFVVANDPSERVREVARERLPAPPR